MLEVKQLAPDLILDITCITKEHGPETTESHRHEYYEIFWALEGEGSHSIDFVEYPLRAGLIYFMTPGQVHCCPVVPDKMLAISFNANLISSDLRSQKIMEQIFLVNRSRHPSIFIDEHGRMIMQKLIDVLTDELSNTHSDYEFINMIFTGFLRHLVRYQPDDDRAPQVNDGRMLNLLEIIDNNFKNHKQTGFYAEKLSLSAKRINELSSKYFGKTVSQLINDKVMVEAKRELAYTSRTIKAISLELGFEDVAYFSRYFKRATGLTPQTFRNNWKESGL
ncbi:helix-turn-helix transcriptional regulator [Parendozoicomonas haliclonae]|uniref:HTH-type transcriptional activator RhaR n=1 Tax=Parendozoicomonas haliclonae TaxID=1960125 RepID=A0A1X7AFS3_9GAMM|nr:helix-turn-helix transcriptional regulator [Parendozoicomonas haliclonae]SMA36524.1 HTH-type transcriptional activator RhaR [Parendozoicomonas haliclonae]